MRKDKVETLIGFAVKAGKVIFGLDVSEKTKNKFYLICVCKTASGNTIKKVNALAAVKNVPVIVAENELQYTVGRKNCKIIAVTDKQMSEAMLDNLGENYHLIGGKVIDN